MFSPACSSVKGGKACSASYYFSSELVQVFSSLWYVSNFLLIPGYLGFCPPKKEGAIWWGFLCYWMLTGVSGLSLLRQGRHLKFCRRTPTEHGGEKGKRRECFLRRQQKHSNVLSAQRWRHAVWAFLPLLSIFPIPCFQNILALSCVLFSSACSAQLAQLSSCHSNEQNGWGPQPSFGREKEMPSPRWSWGEWWMYKRCYSERLKILKFRCLWCQLHGTTTFAVIWNTILRHDITSELEFTWVH